MSAAKQSIYASLVVLLRALRLPSIAAQFETMARRAEQQSWGFEQYLHHLVEGEVADRQSRRIDRLRKQSKLPKDKTMATLKLSRFSVKIRRQVPQLIEGGFVDRAENLLAFGLPGRGKTHLLCAIADELVSRGYRVLFIEAYKLVQQLLLAKRDLALETELRRLDSFDVVLVDDIGYIQQDRDEMEVLFTFLSARYERRSVMISSNLVFSQWDRIFKDPMTTAAAIDRLVHHAIILELSGNSYRYDEAKRRAGDSTDALPPQAQRVEASVAPEP